MGNADVTGVRHELFNQLVRARLLHVGQTDNAYACRDGMLSAIDRSEHMSVWAIGCGRNRCHRIQIFLFDIEDSLCLGGRDCTIVMRCLHDCQAQDMGWLNLDHCLPYTIG